MLIFCVWALVLVSQRFKRPYVIQAAGAVLAGFWIYTHQPYTTLLSSAVSCLQTGNLICQSSQPYTPELLNAVIEQTREDATFMPAFGDNTTLLMLRYTALRPLVFAQKDRVLLGYNLGGEAMRDWYAASNQVNAIREMEDSTARLQALVDLSRELGADYLITLNDEADPSLFPILELDVVFTNEAYSLIRL
jgi:hypothetical protein